MRRKKFNYFKEFKKLNRILDMDYSQLYDKYHDLELSHNRKQKLLKMSKAFVEKLRYYDCPADLWKEAEYLHERLTLELCGLENYKGLKG